MYRYTCRSTLLLLYNNLYRALADRNENTIFFFAPNANSKIIVFNGALPAYIC